MAYKDRAVANKKSSERYYANHEHNKELARIRTARYRAANGDKVRAGVREWARRHPDRIKYLATRNFPRYYKRGDDIILAAKAAPCVDCGGRFHFAAMEFDHVRGEKRMNVGSMRAHAVEDLLAEIAKCDVVCSNCHRVRTFKRQETKRIARGSVAVDPKSEEAA